MDWKQDTFAAMQTILRRFPYAQAADPITDEECLFYQDVPSATAAVLILSGRSYSIQQKQARDLSIAAFNS